MSEHLITPAEQAADAIVHLINARVQSPSKAEITAIIAGHCGGGRIDATDEEGSALATEIRAAMTRATQAIDACGRLHPGPAFDAAEALAGQRWAELRALGAHLPPPRTFGDIVLRAELASLEQPDGPTKTAGERLVEAVCQFVEVRQSCPASRGTSQPES